MKALILSAGFGTRLLPYTQKLPKPLFPIQGKPVLEKTLEHLKNAGCKEAFVNTHHLHEKVETFLAGKDFGLTVTPCYEPEILGTGGAIKNLSPHWGDKPFVVINSDIITDINIKSVFRFHRNHTSPVTMVLHDLERYNVVSVDTQGFIKGFSKGMANDDPNLMAFTGIHVIDPSVISYIPGKGFAGIIDVYRSMILSGIRIKACIAKGHYWKDIGTPDDFREAVFDATAPNAFRRAFPDSSTNPIKICQLKGDGSDRGWYRLFSGNNSLILGDHGIKKNDGPWEARNFVDIGMYLHTNAIPVPEIFISDPFAGLVYVQDLGDQDLMQRAKKVDDTKSIIKLYKKVIDQMVKMARLGLENKHKNPMITSGIYDKTLIRTKECRYFIDAFLNQYLGLNLDQNRFEEEFSNIIEKTTKFSIIGFMHRDFQSRNIMVQGNNVYFIDFQGALKGPIQYDLASLLIDPYVSLDKGLQETLFLYALERYENTLSIDPDKFAKGYKYCRMTRNLQMLGAFGFLTKVKKKPGFEPYIPAAVKSLEANVKDLGIDQFPRLYDIVKKCKSLVP